MPLKVERQVGDITFSKSILSHQESISKCFVCTTYFCTYVCTLITCTHDMHVYIMRGFSRVHMMGSKFQTFSKPQQPSINIATEKVLKGTQHDICQANQARLTGHPTRHYADK